MKNPEPQIVIYKTGDGQTNLRVKIEDETVWLTQDQMSELFDKSKSTINEHIQNIFEENELSEKQTMRKFGISEFSTKPTNYYNLDVIIIYATSIDYRTDDKLTKEFFATVQNKIHYAVHGHTAAEIVDNRADSRKPLMGLTNFKGNYVTAQDVTIAKNYLSESELKQLNLVVSLYKVFSGRKKIHNN